MPDADDDDCHGGRSGGGVSESRDPCDDRADRRSPDNGIYTTYQSLNATARQIAHVVEVSGQADDATISLVTGDGSYINPDSIVFDTTWYNASQKKIQLKTPFTVTITKQVLIPIIKPLSSNPIGIRINISARSSGISEVYWKG